MSRTIAGTIRVTFESGAASAQPPDARAQFEGVPGSL